MYEFSDRELEEELAQRASAGVAVRVMLDNGYFGAGSSINEQAYDYFRQHGVAVAWSPAHLALTHEKALVVDAAQALIMTFNFTPQYYKSDRDFGVLDTDSNDVAAIEQVFDADWHAQHVQVSQGGLVWSPGSRDPLLALINGAQHSLDVYNEEMQDSQIITALEDAARRGADVEVAMTASSNWKAAFEELSTAGVHVRTFKADAPLYIHAKVIVADGSRAFVGSENFSSTSLDQNRELGIIVSDPALVSSLQRTFTHDERGASPFLVQ